MCRYCRPQVDLGHDPATEETALRRTFTITLAPVNDGRPSPCHPAGHPFSPQCECSVASRRRGSCVGIGVRLNPWHREAPGVQVYAALVILSAGSRVER
jgi:hypothetical protein